MKKTLTLLLLVGLILLGVYHAEVCYYFGGGYGG